MKTTKRILSVLLALAMGLGLLGITANAAVPENLNPYLTMNYAAWMALQNIHKCTFDDFGGPAAFEAYGAALESAETPQKISNINMAFYDPDKPKNIVKHINGRNIADIIEEAANLFEHDLCTGFMSDWYLVRWLQLWCITALLYLEPLPGKTTNDFYSAYQLAHYNIRKTYGLMYFPYWVMASEGSVAKIEEPLEQVIEAYYGPQAVSFVKNYFIGYATQGYVAVSPVSAFASAAHLSPGNILLVDNIELNQISIPGKSAIMACDISVCSLITDPVTFEDDSFVSVQPNGPVTVSLCVPENYVGDLADLTVYQDGVPLPCSPRTVTTTANNITATIRFLDVTVDSLGTFCIAEPSPFYDQVPLEEGTVSVIYPYETFDGTQPRLNVTASSTGNTGVHDYDDYYTPVPGYSWNITFGDGQQPAGEVTVRVPFPPGANVNDLRVCHVDSGGTYAPMTILNLDKAAAAGYLEFKTDHFSVYAVFQRHEHRYTGVTTPPTCTAQGYTTFTCAEDGSSYADHYAPALGHEWGGWVITIPATTESEGVETRVCARDASHTETRAIAKLQPAAQKWWQKLPAWVQWILRYLCFGWLWMK